MPAAGTHGGDGPAVARALGIDPADLLDLSQNLNPFAPDVADLVSRHLDALGHYPDAAPGTRLLADVIGVDPDRLLLTNGGSEAITLVAAELGGGVQSEPEFALHPRQPVAALTEGPIWRSNPHSPTGTLTHQALHDRARVWDEAFYPLATGRWTAGLPGVVVGSLTKIFACPGLRLGYVIAETPQQRRRIAARQPHWSVSALSLACLPELLAVADLPSWAERIAHARERLTADLKARGFVVQAGAAPWVLVDAPGLRERLAPQGVLVRDCASFGLPGWARIAVPTDEGRARLRHALDLAGTTCAHGVLVLSHPCNRC